MKKILFIVSTLCITTIGVFAQGSAESSVLTNKKGMAILPVKGDVAIGMSADPFLYYIGNMFNGNPDNSFDLGSTTLYGKYYVADNAALRASIYLSNTTNNNKYYVRDDAKFAADPLSQDKVVDVQKIKNRNIGVGLSYQKYRGYGRLQGFYGVYANYRWSRSQTENIFGNPISELNQAPSTYLNNNASERSLSYDSGISQSAGAGLLAGVEYFFMPKVSIGAELNLGYSYNWSSQSNYVYEKWNGSKVAESDVLNAPGSSSASFSTYLPSTYGTLFLMFHF